MIELAVRIDIDRLEAQQDGRDVVTLDLDIRTEQTPCRAAEADIIVILQVAVRRGSQIPDHPLRPVVDGAAVVLGPGHSRMVQVDDAVPAGGSHTGEVDLNAGDVIIGSPDKPLEQR